VTHVCIRHQKAQGPESRLTLRCGCVELVSLWESVRRLCALILWERSDTVVQYAAYLTSSNPWVKAGTVSFDSDYSGKAAQFHRQARAAWSTYGSRVKVTVAREMHFGTSPEWFVLKRLGLRMVGSDTPTTVLSARLKEWNEKHILSPRRNRPLGTVDPFLFWCHQCRLRFTGPSRTRRCETCRLLICGTRVSGGNRRHRSIVTNPVRPPSGG